MYYLIVISILISSLFSGFYNDGDYVSEQHQNITQTTCYPGNGYEDGDLWKLADWNGSLNGGDYNVIVIIMAASW